MFGGKVNGLTIVSLAFLIFLIYQVLLDRSSGGINRPQQLPSTGGQIQNAQVAPASLPETEPQQSDNPDIVAAPYAEYVLTQGPHGYSYGHMAIDLAAGKGTAVLSPINGVVTDKYTDQWGNPTLVIENDHYRVLLLHGKYSVAVNDTLQVGDPVGTESNKGYTVDYQGIPCYNRDCGYHTHLNIYDKNLGANVNPLELISP
jgi:murein DD-endopeptidase MepM/ murein hydrolase activator NlpD